MSLDHADENGQRSVRFHPCPPGTKRFVDGKPLGEWTVRRVALGTRCA